MPAPPSAANSTVGQYRRRRGKKGRREEDDQDERATAVSVSMEEAAGHELSHLEFLELILQDELLRNPLHDDDQQPTAGGLGQVDRRRPHATAILDRFLHHAEVIAITGKSYRLRNQATPANSSAEESKPANLPTGSAGRRKPKPAAETTIAATVAACEK